MQIYRERHKTQNAEGCIESTFFFFVQLNDIKIKLKVHRMCLLKPNERFSKKFTTVLRN